MWRKEKHCALLVGMLIGASMEFPQKKLEVELPCDSAIPHFWVLI